MFLHFREFIFFNNVSILSKEFLFLNNVSIFREFLCFWFLYLGGSVFLYFYNISQRILIFSFPCSFLKELLFLLFLHFYFLNFFYYPLLYSLFPTSLIFMTSVHLEKQRPHFPRHSTASLSIYSLAPTSYFNLPLQNASIPNKQKQNTPRKNQPTIEGTKFDSTNQRIHRCYSPKNKMYSATE